MITNVCSVHAFDAQFNTANKFPYGVDTVVPGGEF